jgi:hypothetical protein
MPVKVICNAHFMSELASHQAVIINKKAPPALLALYWNIHFQMQYTMALDTGKKRESEEKQWENPADPAMTTDDRDKEQLLRQYKEAKRRKDNLTTSEEDKTDKNI